MRRPLSFTCLLLAWLCAQGAVWDVVQVVAWCRMYTVYSSYLPAGRALARTFDGSQPCELCLIAQQGRDAAREQPAATPGGGDRLVLVCDTAAPLVVAAPDFAWPDPVAACGRTRTEAVPVPPPRV